MAQFYAVTLSGVVSRTVLDEVLAFAVEKGLNVSNIRASRAPNKRTLEDLSSIDLLDLVYPLTSEHTAKSWWELHRKSFGEFLGRLGLRTAEDVRLMAWQTFMETSRPDEGHHMAKLLYAMNDNGLRFGDFDIAPLFVTPIQQKDLLRAADANALAGEGLLHLEVLQVFTEAQLMEDYRGIGEKSIEKIKVRLQERGLAFRD